MLLPIGFPRLWPASWNLRGSCKRSRPLWRLLRALLGGADLRRRILRPITCLSEPRRYEDLCNRRYAGFDWLSPFSATARQREVPPLPPSRAALGTAVDALRLLPQAGRRGRWWCASQGVRVPNDALPCGQALLSDGMGRQLGNVWLRALEQTLRVVVSRRWPGGGHGDGHYRRGAR